MFLINIQIIFRCCLPVSKNELSSEQLGWQGFINKLFVTNEYYKFYF